MRRRDLLAGAAAALMLLAPAVARPTGAFTVRTWRYTVRVVPLTQALEHPWGFDFLPGGDILITERPGRLRLVRGGVLAPEPVAGIPKAYGWYQGGLLDLALHPGFPTPDWVYLSYAAGDDRRWTTAVSRARWDGSGLVQRETVFRAVPMIRGAAHYGSRVALDGLGHLFVTVGDRRIADEAQNPAHHLGKIIRLGEDGSVPADNPFVGRRDVRPEIWALGSRNAQGLAIQPGTGLLWACEHGDAGGDELNIVRAGRNLGWPVIGYGRRYDGSPVGVGTALAGMTQPLRYWVPSIAPSGLSFYTGALFPAWQGNVFMGALRGQQVLRMKVKADGASYRVTAQESLLLNRIGRVRQVKPGPDGCVYVCTDEAPGGLWRIEPV